MLDTITRTFTDRHAAGRELAQRLMGLAAEDPIVLGLARGGMPVAYEVAQALGAPLDVRVVRKIGAPGNPEYGIGAVAEGDVGVLNERAVAQMCEGSAIEIPDADVEQLTTLGGALGYLVSAPGSAAMVEARDPARPRFVNGRIGNGCGAGSERRR